MEQKCKSSTSSLQDGFSKLGREIKISPKSLVTINKPGYKKEFYVDSVTLIIGIGNDHTAELVMDKEAWDALNSGEKVGTTTYKDFVKKYL